MPCRRVCVVAKRVAPWVSGGCSVLKIIVAWTGGFGPIAPAVSDGDGCAVRETNPTLPHWQPNRDAMTVELRETNPESAKMAVCRGEWVHAALTKQSQPASLARGNVRNEPTSAGREDRRSRERIDGQRGGTDCTDRKNHITASLQRRGATRQNKAAILGQEGIAPMGTIPPGTGRGFGSPESGGGRSVRWGGSERPRA